MSQTIKGGQATIIVNEEEVIKIYNKNHKDSYDAYIREIEFLKNSNSDFVIKLIGLYETDDEIGFKMEYAKNGSLSFFIESKKEKGEYINYPLLSKYNISFCICKGLKKVHDIGKGHNDIKSDNIVLDVNENGLLIDFGFISDSCIDIPIGSVPYKSPEIFKNSESFLKKSDIYSLGIVFWEILTGEKPFKNLKGNEIKTKVLNNERPEINFTEPIILIYLIKKCWDKNPEIRPSIENLIYNEKGDSNGSFNLGNFYYLGNILEQNYFESFKYFLKSSQENNSDAMFIISLMYLEGKGIEQNFELYKKYLFKSAENGNSNAQLRVGLNYYFGDDYFEQNYFEAFNWIHKSANKGNSFAQNNLGIYYYDINNFYESFKWYSLSAKQNNKNAFY